MSSRLTFIHALSSLHAGVGQGSGVIDLPIAREKATGIPFLPGSSLKGALRTQCTMRPETKNDCDKIFGPSTILGDNDNQASLIQVTDQRLLLLPVQSLAGTFAWVTAPYVLQRFLRDNQATLGDVTQKMPVPQVKKTECIVSKGNCVIKLETNKEVKVYLKELKLGIDQSEDADMSSWADWLGKQIFLKQADFWRTALRQRICLVHDDVFSFLLQTATEINARIRMEEDSKTVKDGGLWYEETLPAESILSGLLLTTQQQRNSGISLERIAKVLDILTEQPLQLGGKATVGHGLCNVRLTNGGN